MTDHDDDALRKLAAAVLDGTAIDWDEADTRTAAPDRPFVDQLRRLADIARAHRENGLWTWGSLRLLERIGSGSFGEVYRAWDPHLDRHIALKLLPADRQERLIEEGRRLARVRHPNVVTIHGAERIGDRVGLWMEYVDGRTLHDLVVAEGRRFTPSEASAIGRTLCAAVGAVHDAGLLHRDITARNVMMTGDGRLVLMDFGSGRDLGHIRAGELSGTPLYLAPEVLSGDEPPSVRSDIYSLGVLLYFLLTGGFPVRDADLDSLRRAHAMGERRPLATVSGRASERLRRAVTRAIDPQPGHRFEHTAALASALDDPPSRWSVASRAAALGLILAAGGAVLSSGRLTRDAAPVVEGADATSPPTAMPGAGADARAREFRRAWALAEAEGVIGPANAAKVFTSMLATDASYAPAYAGLVVANAFLSMNPYQGRSYAQVHAEMRTAALTALRLDPALAEAHVARGWVHARELEWADAERSFREALRRDPLLLGAYTGLTHSTLMPLGRFEEAEQLVRQAIAHDPAAPHIQLTLGRVLVHANRPADAIAVLEPARRADSDLLQVDLYLGRSLALLGRFAEALPLLERRRQRLVDPAAAPEPWVAWAYVALGRRADAEALADKYDHLPFRRAIINGAVGRADRMFHGLEEMAEREPQRLAHLLWAPELAEYRADPRFLQLVHRLRLNHAVWGTPPGR
jgi:tetratricopeptide (TPR) repeat protein